MKTHKLKTDPKAFAASFRGDKPFEIRFDDREFSEGDLLVLKETEFSGSQMTDGAPLEYTGRVLSREITHRLEGTHYGLLPGWVVLGVRTV